MDYILNWFQKNLKVVFLVLTICLLLVLSYTSAKKEKYSLVEVELINKGNSFLVGKEIVNHNPKVVPQVEQNSIADQPEQNNSSLPDNPICHSVADEATIPGTSITEIVTADCRTPEIIIPNGAIGIFSKGNASGWFCKSNEILSLEFEKYPMKNGTSQTLGIGYIQDGVMHEIQLFRNSLDGKYELTVLEDGIYHIFVVCLSSDPISLKDGEIFINNKN